MNADDTLFFCTFNRVITKNATRLKYRTAYPNAIGICVRPCLCICFAVLKLNLVLLDLVSTPLNAVTSCLLFD